MDQVALSEGLQGLNGQAEKLVIRAQEIADRLHGPAPTSAGVPSQNRSGLLGSMDSLASKLQFISEIVGAIELGVGTVPPQKNMAQNAGGIATAGFHGRHN